MNELVSVLMPAKNAAVFIEKSIYSIINQTYKNLELIIINDKSTDNTLEIIQSFNDSRISVITGPGTGIADAFNTGLAQAKGKYLCRCDSDDLYPLERITEQVEWLETHQEYIAVCGMYSSIDTKNRHLIQYNRGTFSMNLDEKFADGIIRTHYCTFLTRTDVLKNIGGCRTFFVTAEDLDLQFRLSEKGSIYFIAKNTYLYRLHDFSITHSQNSCTREFYESFARKCHQQRLNEGIDDLQKNIIPEIPKATENRRNSENHILNQLISESWYWHGEKQKIKALNTAFKGVRIFPRALKAWKNVFMIGLKPAKF